MIFEDESSKKKKIKRKFRTYLRNKRWPTIETARIKCHLQMNKNVVKRSWVVPIGRNPKRETDFPLDANFKVR